MWVLLHLSCQTTLPNPAEFNQKGVNGGYGWWRGWRLITCITDGRPMGNTRSAVSSLLLCYCSPLKGQQVRWSNCWKKPWQCSGWIRWWVAAAANLRFTINPPDLIGRKILHLFKNAPHLQLKCILNLFLLSSIPILHKAKNIHILPTFRGNSQGKKLFQLLCFPLRRNAATKLCHWLRCKNFGINLTLEAWNWEARKQT